MVENRERRHDNRQALTHSARSAGRLVYGLITVYLLTTGYPPPPSVFGIITLPHFSWQNTAGKGLRSQNPENKGVRSRFLARSGPVAFAEFIAFAWAIIE
jgi:hypothetical protein